MILALVARVKNISSVMANSVNHQAPASAGAAVKLHVAVGVIVRDKHILVSFRNSKQHQGGKWEFPGGKVEQGESTEQALGRELHEELGIVTLTAEPFMTISHQYPEREVLLDIWLVTQFSGEPAGQEGQPVQWVSIAGLSELVFPDANQPIVERIQQQLA